MRRYLLQLMNSEFKTMNSAFKMMDFASQMMNCVLKPMDFDEFWRRRTVHCLQM